jgi:N-glycosylase/DNA lyase
MAFEEVQARLTQERGIGLKIADCVALFGLGHFEAFPIDTHVHQFMAQWFKVPAASRSLTPATYRQLTLEAREILGSHYTGYAAHLLFHCWRCEVKKLCWF